MRWSAMIQANTSVVSRSYRMWIVLRPRMWVVEFLNAIPCEAELICHWESCKDGGILGTLMKQPLIFVSAGSSTWTRCTWYGQSCSSNVLYKTQCDTPSRADTLLVLKLGSPPTTAKIFSSTTWVRTPRGRPAPAVIRQFLIHEFADQHKGKFCDLVLGH
jgi:hypothetical protein